MGDVNILKLESPRFSPYQDDGKPRAAAVGERPKANHLVVEKKGERETGTAETNEPTEVELPDDSDTGFSFEFSSSASFDPPSNRRMLSAEELFSNGKLRPLSKEVTALVGPEMEHVRHGSSEWQLPHIVFQGGDAVPRRKSDAQREPRRGRYGLDVEFAANLPLVRTSLDERLAMAKQRLTKLHESPRCLSMTIEGSRGHPRRSCVSLNSSRCSSPTRIRPSGTFSQPPTTPTSPKASTSAQRSSKFLQFFKLRKHIASTKEVLLLSSDTRSAPSGGRAGRTFWPFLRSNSAGERKRSHAISGFPRRSNSAGESKTASSPLIPGTKHDAEVQRNGNSIEASIVAFRRSQANPCLGQQTDQQCPSLLPMQPLPLQCGTDSIALPQAADFLQSSTAPTPLPVSEEVKKVVIAHSNDTDLATQSNSTHSRVPSETRKGNFAGHGGYVRLASASNPAGDIKKASQARQWSHPTMRRPTRGMQQIGALPRGLNAWPRDTLTRDAASLRVTPVLNVPACLTPSSRSKLFNLSNLFSKRDKISKGYTVLATGRSESGA